MSEWKKQANAIAARMKGQPFEDVRSALADVRTASEHEAVRWMATDEQLDEYARIVAGGRDFSWR